MFHKRQLKTPDVIDVYVGSRIRLQRKLNGISQTALAEGLGITFQQVQKYEKGTNRVGSSRLQAIANILGVPVSFFFEEGPGALSDKPSCLDSCDQPLNADKGDGSFDIAGKRGQAERAALIT